MNTPISLPSVPGCRLWIDGVGCWLLWFRDSLTIGNAGVSSTRDNRLRLPADLRTNHATWKRSDGDDWIVPSGQCRLNGKEISETTRIDPQDRLQLGTEVEWIWNRPSPLSESASVSLRDLRSQDHLDGIVLFRETCLLGPGEQVHIPCPQWEKTWILFTRQGKLWGREMTAAESWPIIPSQIYQQGEWRFHFDPLPDSGE